MEFGLINLIEIKCQVDHTRYVEHDIRVTFHSRYQIVIELGWPNRGYRHRLA